MSVTWWKLFANCHLFAVADCKDGREDAEGNNVAATNSILLTLLTDRLKNIHDIELPLCDHDTAHIVKLLYDRNCNNTDYVLPPGVPARFRCYVRILSSSHLILTVVPAMYDDMITIMSMLDSPGSVVDLAGDEDKNLKAATERVDSSRIPTDQDLNTSKNLEEACDDVKSAEFDTLNQSADAAADEQVTAKHQLNIRLPVFVFDCLLNSVSDQLVHHSCSERPPDIAEDFTYQVTAAVFSQVDS